MQNPVLPLGSDGGNFNPPTLKNFFVFSPKNVPEGMEHEKIMYFYPSDVPIDQKTKHVGLSEAMVNFTSKFSPNQACEGVHYEKHTSAFFHPEEDFWIIMAVNNPFVVKVKEGKTVIEYKENEIDDIALQTALRQSYRMFKLFYGTFEYIRDTFGEDKLKKDLDYFFNQYILSLNVDQIDLFNTLDGIQFLPVDKNIYLRIQSFVNLCENSITIGNISSSKSPDINNISNSNNSNISSNKIKNTCFLYKDHLVWSGFEQDDTRIIYRFVVLYLLPALFPNTDEEEDDEDDRKSLKPLKVPFITLNGNREGFLTGPKDKQAGALPNIFIGGRKEPFKLIIFQQAEAVCLFLVEDPSTTDPKSKEVLIESSALQNLGIFVSEQIRNLVPILEENYMKKQGNEDQYKYIYFNHMNFALKTSIKEKGLGIARDTMKMLNDIHTDFEKSPENISEVLVRTQNDKWVVGRKSDQREFYVIFDNKNSHLIEINEEVKKLSSTYFNNIFID